MKFATKSIWHYQPHLRHVATLPWEIKKWLFCRYSADMEENAKCNFNSSMRVTVYTECVYVLTEYLKILSIQRHSYFWYNVGGSEKSWLLCERFMVLSTVPVSHNFFNSLLTPCFVQLFSLNSSVNLFAVYLFKYKLFIKILSSSLNTMLFVNKHCNDICCDEFLMPQIDRNSK